MILMAYSQRGLEPEIISSESLLCQDDGDANSLHCRFLAKSSGAHSRGVSIPVCIQYIFEDGTTHDTFSNGPPVACSDWPKTYRQNYKNDSLLHYYYKNTFPWSLPENDDFLKSINISLNVI